MYHWDTFPTACYRNNTWLQHHMARHMIQADSQKCIGYPYQHCMNETRKTFLKNMIFLAVATVFVSISSKASVLNKPRWTLPGSFNDPLAFIFFCGLFSIIKDNSLHSRSIKWSSLLFTYFHPYQSSFCFDLCITIATKDMLLFQVSTLRTNIYVPLKNSRKQ